MVVRHTLIWSICLASIVLITAIAFSQEDGDSLTVIPDQIEINTFYHGTKVEIEANVPSCDAAVLVLEGNEEEITLNRKGRVAIIWMNVAQITISGLPDVYILAASDKLDNICSEETQEKLRLGLKSLRPLMKIHSSHPLTGSEFEQFLKLKTRRGTYDTDSEASLKSLPSGRMKLTSVLPIPSQMPPGTYEINLYCFSQGNMVDEETAPLKIERIGLPHLMINLANKHAAAYGLIAIIVAMAVGIIMGLIFSSLPGKGR